MTDTFVPAIEVVNRYTSSIPVNLESMARSLGIDVVIEPRASNFSGSIKRERAWGSDRFVIRINGRHTRARQRFTLAHEIAHYVLHRDRLVEGVTDNEMYRSGLGEDLEYEANRFAGDILMPAPLVRAAWKSGARSISPLATAFDVSDEAMRIRLKQLGFAP